MDKDYIAIVSVSHSVVNNGWIMVRDFGCVVDTGWIVVRECDCVVDKG